MKSCSPGTVADLLRLADNIRNAHYIAAYAYQDGVGQLLGSRYTKEHQDMIETALREAAGVAQAPAEPLKFFSESVDAWGAAEWFNRLATAIRQQDAAVLAKDDATMEICRNVAASSAMRLVRDYEQQVRVALSVVSSTTQAPATCPACGNSPPTALCAVVTSNHPRGVGQ